MVVALGLGVVVQVAPVSQWPFACCLPTDVFRGCSVPAVVFQVEISERCAAAMVQYDQGPSTSPSAMVAAQACLYRAQATAIPVGRHQGGTGGVLGYHGARAGHHHSCPSP